MQTILHKAGTRGLADRGWLKSNHTFSFASYYNPERMHFGVLRVLNDDVVAPGRGFGRHPHDNMEIISIPLSGDLQHEDSLGNVAVIKQGDIQAMSAGTGVTHSEMNAKADTPVEFLQIWVFPKSRNVTPNYSQITLDPAALDNQLDQILSPNPNDRGVAIHQNAWFHLGNIASGTTLNYDIKKSGNGVYAFVLEGDVTIANQSLNKRDGFGIWDTNKISITADNDTKLLLMEVPMELPGQ
ncbi:MAG: pirin family protein [Bacteroidota bacterium]